MLSMFDGNIGSDGSPIASAIEQATDPMLLHADWSRNLDICDLINDAAEGHVSAVKMLRKKLRSENPKTVTLALELTDACVKNCSTRFHFAVANKQFLGDVVALTDGKRGWEIRDQALKLIQQWDESFKDKRDHLPAFHEVYASLRTKGFSFPNQEQSAPVFTPPPAMFDDEPSGAGGQQSNSQAQGGESEGSELSKLKDDLNALREKIMLCREMLPESPGIEHDETLAEVIGFLEACQPRMVDLVEAGMMGMLGEELLSIALQVNDDLNKTLEAEKNGTPLPKIETQSAASQANTSENTLLDFETPSAPPANNDDVEEEEELSGRRKGKNRQQRSVSPPKTASDPNVDIFSNVQAPSLPPTEVAAVPARSSGRFMEEATPTATDPFASLTAPTPQQAPGPSPNETFPTPPISNNAPPVVPEFGAAPADPFSNSTPADVSDDPFGSSPADPFNSTASTNPPEDPFGSSPANPFSNPEDPFGSSPADPFSSTTPVPPQTSSNPFDFDVASSYVAPPSSDVVSQSTSTPNEVLANDEPEGASPAV